MGVIYKITNNINGKSYIGQTNNFQRRITEHFCKAKDNYAIHEAIRKYGKNNFSVKIIDLCNDDEIDEREKYWIVQYKTHISQGGYNMTWGGDNADALERWRKENFDLVYKNAINGLKYADEWNKTHKEAALKNVLAAQKKGAEAVMKKVHCIELDLVFDSLSAAEAWSKSDDNPNGKVAYHQHISKVCKGQRHTTGGYHWEYI